MARARGGPPRDDQPRAGAGRGRLGLRGRLAGVVRGRRADHRRDPRAQLAPLRARRRDGPAHLRGAPVPRRPHLRSCATTPTPASTSASWPATGASCPSSRRAERAEQRHHPGVPGVRRGVVLRHLGDVDCGVSRISGTPSLRGSCSSQPNAAVPIFPSPISMWRSRFEPSAPSLSFKWKNAGGSPAAAWNSSRIRASAAARLGDVVPRREEVTGVEPVAGALSQGLRGRPRGWRPPHPASDRWSSRRPPCSRPGAACRPGTCSSACVIARATRTTADEAIPVHRGARMKADAARADRRGALELLREPRGRTAPLLRRRRSRC